MRFVTLAISKGYPRVPWQNLSQFDKDLITKDFLLTVDMAIYEFTSLNPAIVLSSNDSNEMSLGQWKKQLLQRVPKMMQGDMVKQGFFLINLTYGEEFLIKEFKKQIRILEGKPMFKNPLDKIEKPKSKPVGRKSARDSLNYLGAIRLRYHCKTFSEARQKMIPLKDTGGLWYAKRSGFNRACTAGLEHFYKLLGWLDSGMPIHFTAGWGSQK